MSGFSIGARQVGGGAPCFIIAEVGLAHDGSLSQAHAYIDAVAKLGVDAVKFQCRIPGTETTPNEWRVKPEWSQDASRYDYWKRTAFAAEEWNGLAGHARKREIEFLCSPFSVEAVRTLDPLVKAWKIPSGEVMNVDLLTAIRATGKPVILSTGMSTRNEIDLSANIMDDMRLGLHARAILQCTSEYPTIAKHVGLQTLKTYKARFPDRVIGLSDHSGTIYAGLASVALGAKILEVHICFSKEQGGPDTSSSLDLGQLRQLVEGVQFIEKALKPIDKDALARELQPMRDLFMTRAEGFSLTDA